MPTVPTYENFQVAPTTTPDVNYSAPSGPNGQQIVGQQMQDAGGALQKAGDSVSRIALSMAEQVNQVKVNDAVNQARRAAQDLAYNPATGYLNLKGDAALTRPGGQALPEEFGDKLKTSMSEISGGLTNEDQRRAFQANATDLSTQFNGQVVTHMLGEFREHTLSVQDGTINLASDDAKRNWQNPDLIGPSLNAAKAAVVEKGRVSGWSASQTDAALLTTTSKVHTDVVMAALENNNPNYAMQYLDARRSQMTADDILRVQGHVNQNMWMNQSLQAVQSATTKAMPAIKPTSFDRMTQITAQTESGGKDFRPDGSVLQGPSIPGQGTAKGRMQVMDATAANPGYGIAPASTTGTPQEQADDRARVGTQLLQALVQKYGDPAKAWAAYNAGAGNVDKAIADSARDAASGAYRGVGGQPANDWLDKLAKYQSASNHKQTVDYVTKNVAQLSGSGGIAPRPTEMEFVNSAVTQLPPGSSPQAVKMTRDQAVQQFGIITKSMNEVGQNFLGDAQRWLAANNGDLDAMPAALRDGIAANAPGDMFNLSRYAKMIQRGPEIPIKSDLVLYNRLATHPEEAAGMTDPQFEQLRTELSIADFKHFSNERSNFINGKIDETAGAINTTAMKASLNPRLASLQINAAPNYKDTAAVERVGGIRLFVRNSLFDAQRQAGKKFTADEVETHIDKLFATNVDFKNSLWGTTSSQNLMSMQKGDLPSGAFDGLKQALIKSGNKAPTDNDVVNLYRKMHVAK